MEELNVMDVVLTLRRFMVKGKRIYRDSAPKNSFLV